MFSEHTLSEQLRDVRADHAPDAIVLDADSDFETLPPAQAEELGLLVDSIDPASFPSEWVPADAPDILRQYAGEEFTIGLPGDGGVLWTRQTDPPVIVVKPRLEGSPETFVDFLVAEALVEVGLDRPEQFLGFFGEQYPVFQTAAGGRLDGVGVYQVAAACYDAFLGLHTREVFTGWESEYPDLFEAWVDAGERLDPRLSGLMESLTRGETDFGNAAELACSAIKHGVEIPNPFDALDTDAYREHGPDYAIKWAERTFEALD